MGWAAMLFSSEFGSKRMNTAWSSEEKPVPFLESDFSGYYPLHQELLGVPVLGWPSTHLLSVV